MPRIFPQAFRSHGVPPVYFEAASMINGIGAARSDARTRRARGDIWRDSRFTRSGAEDRAPRQATTAATKTLRSMPSLPATVSAYVPATRSPVDGTLLEGHSSLDESMVTGESMPVTKDKDARVIGGTINRSGSFVMRAEKVGRDTLLSQIVQMVATAQRSRAPIQRLADQVAGWFVPAVVAVALAAFAAWAMFGPEPRFAYALVATVKAC